MSITTNPARVTVYHRQVPVNAMVLHVAEAGPPDGPLVILLHGYPDFWWGWRHQIGPLALAGYRVVAPDMRGYNQSDKPKGVSAYQIDTLASDAAALADVYGRQRFRLVGHDWGGLVAWQTAIRYPDRIAHLAILNAPHPDTWQKVMRHDPIQLLKSWYVGWFQIPAFPEAALSLNNFALLRVMLAHTSLPGAFDDRDFRRYLEAWRKPGALTAMINYYRALPMKPAGLHRVAPPTLVLWGLKDVSLQPANLDAALALCDQGQGRVFPGASHWSHRDFPDLVNAALMRFFESAT